MEQLTLQQKSELRVKALMVAKEINPPDKTEAWGSQPVIKKVSAIQILKDAQTIYKWLAEGESNYEAAK